MVHIDFVQLILTSHCAFLWPKTIRQSFLLCVIALFFPAIHYIVFMKHFHPKRLTDFLLVWATYSSMCCSRTQSPLLRLIWNPDSLMADVCSLSYRCPIIQSHRKARQSWRKLYVVQGQRFKPATFQLREKPFSLQVDWSWVHTDTRTIDTRIVNRTFFLTSLRIKNFKDTDQINHDNQQLSASN